MRKSLLEDARKALDLALRGLEEYRKVGEP
jgi:hypothetical protein